MGLLFSYIRLYWIHRSYVAFSTSKGRMKKRYIICSVKGKHVTIMPYIRVQTGVQKKMTVLQTSYLSVFANGSNLRVPSRADKIKRLSQWIVALFYQHEMFWNPHNFIMRVPEKVHRTFSHLALWTRAKLRFGGFRKQSTGLFSISRLLKLRLFYSPNLRLLASTA